MECPLQQDTNISLQAILWPHNMQLHNSWLSDCITAIWQNCTVKLFVAVWYLPYDCSDHLVSHIARFMGPTWGPAGAHRTQVGPMLAPLTFLTGIWFCNIHVMKNELTDDNESFASTRNYHNDMVVSKCFSEHWQFMRESTLSLVDSLHKGPVMQRSYVSFIISLNKLLNKSIVVSNFRQCKIIAMMSDVSLWKWPLQHFSTVDGSVYFTTT